MRIEPDENVVVKYDGGTPRAANGQLIARTEAMLRPHRPPYAACRTHFNYTLNGYKRPDRAFASAGYQTDKNQESARSGFQQAPDDNAR